MKRIWDALLGLLWVHVCLVTGMKVEQSPSALSLQEGASSILKCNYSSAVNNVQWFRQNPEGGSLTRLFYIASGMKQSGRLNCTLNAKERFSTLHVAASQLEDSATYLCAVEAHSTNNLVFGRGTMVKVDLNVQDPDPSVYQMRSPKTGRTVCLFTDFDSQADFQKPEGATVISLNSTVLDMKVMDSKSNGALTWNSETNIECKENFQQPFYPSSNYSCDAKLIEKSFETDMDLNFYNLLVIGLRILLLKVIGFNLFMTLRLWSC
ncbi:T-cell receptor alpha chain C region isoform X2 [Canis lupus familiaris]|uniref:T-cell receptor alpha chain C region isoform X2 n=1 Tax=Canis lupus familiaris TaxID=9615 RepID=UPI0018F72032|nr:T-cell receptor alpha chain C region isoform X2 [Canis lupus familiaris]XP_038528999.1 T-cell receptor alpha chain C region isoform X2 [Canis lupus familiaris]